MRIFKFGGASVKDAKSVLNLVDIIKHFSGENLWVIVSAMGKMTNRLELVLDDYYNGIDYTANLKEVENFHLSILEELFPFRAASIYSEFYELIDKLKDKLSKPSSKEYFKEYSTIVSFGELISTKIVSSILSESHLENNWIDIRKVIMSDGGYQQVDVAWEKTQKNIQRILKADDEKRHPTKLKVTQGFIAANKKNETTTLGREGSDFTGAVLAWCLNAQDLTIWKDVPGLMNADPKKFPKAVLLNRISYREALELSFYGASVIHPKTIKPLQNKGIPLLVKSFLDPVKNGTIIHEREDNDVSTPSFISKTDQVLLSISPRDFSMVVEKNISDLYGIISEIGININLMQNSALNFSICFDSNDNKLASLKNALNKKYKMLYNDRLELLTIRHYTDNLVLELLKDRKIILEQRTRQTARFLLQEKH
ncbi:MAG: aspartate kinase [Patiriisocius sp.]|jgi:aspartate kinase